MLRALIFDVDGTLADTEAGHLAAFNQAFADFGLNWHWNDALYCDLLTVSGGKERILHYWKSAAPQSVPAACDLQDVLDRLHQLKTAAYTRSVRDGAIGLRAGVRELLTEAGDNGLPLAIATTTSPANIDALLVHELGSDWRSAFAVIGDAVTAPNKKPDPEVYQQVLAGLGLESRHCLAFEDSANGLRASQGAGIATLITPTRFTAGHDFSGALRVCDDLGEVGLAELQRWHGDYWHRK